MELSLLLDMNGPRTGSSRAIPSNVLTSKDGLTPLQSKDGLYLTAKSGTTRMYIADYLNTITGTELSEVRTSWRRISPDQIIHESAVASAVTNTLTLTTLRTVTIPAGLMGANDALRIRSLWSCTNSANNKQFMTVFNGAAGTTFWSTGQTTITILPNEHIIANRNATNSQVGLNSGNSSGWNTSTSTLVTSAIDTTVAVDLLFRGQMAALAETITLEYSLVELIRAPV